MPTLTVGPKSKTAVWKWKNDTKTKITQVLIELHQEIFTNSQLLIKGFHKWEVNLIFDLLVFVYQPIFYFKMSILALTSPPPPFFLNLFL